MPEHFSHALVQVIVGCSNDDLEVWSDVSLANDQLENELAGHHSEHVSSYLE